MVIHTCVTSWNAATSFNVGQKCVFCIRSASHSAIICNGKHVCSRVQQLLTVQAARDCSWGVFLVRLARWQLIQANSVYEKKVTRQLCKTAIVFAGILQVMIQILVVQFDRNKHQPCEKTHTFHVISPLWYLWGRCNGMLKSIYYVGLHIERNVVLLQFRGI